jgi:hypothetical protein
MQIHRAVPFYSFLIKRLDSSQYKCLLTRQLTPYQGMFCYPFGFAFKLYFLALSRKLAASKKMQRLEGSMRAHAYFHVIVIVLWVVVLTLLVCYCLKSFTISCMTPPAWFLGTPSLKTFSVPLSQTRSSGSGVHLWYFCSCNILKFLDFRHPVTPVKDAPSLQSLVRCCPSTC